MGKLLKYEFRKSRTIHIITLCIIGALEVMLLIGIAGKVDWLVIMAALILTLSSLFVPALICIASAVSLHSDMTNKRGYMLFMTPRNSYQILGAKVMENAISIFVGDAVILALGFADVALLFARYESIEFFWQMLSQLMTNFIGLNIRSGLIIAFFFMTLCSMLFTTTAIYFSDVLASGLLNGRKISWLLAVGFFITIDVLVSVLSNVIFKPALIPDDILRLSLTGVFSLVCGVGMYFGAAALMDRHLNV